MPLTPPLLHCFAGVLLALGTAFAQAQTTAERTPREVIDALGPEIRQLQAKPRADRTPADAEREAASHISALIARAPGHLQLTVPDAEGRTPLMLAVGAGYLPVVEALLTDPSVRLQINEPDKDGVSAWMLANFVPGVTLVACQPGALTVERASLLVPYVQRMAQLLGEDGSPPGAMIRALEAAGAEIRPDEAKRAWLARCPNADPELRGALAHGPLMKTLVTHAIQRQSTFNRQATEERGKLADRPPEDMVFTPRQNRTGRTAELLKIEAMNCPVMAKPELSRFAPNWQGAMVIKAIVSTRAGIVETVDLEVTRKKRDPPQIANYFRAVVVQALAGYHCQGEHVFEQEFQFSIR